MGLGPLEPCLAMVWVSQGSLAGWGTLSACTASPRAADLIQRPFPFQRKAKAERDSTVLLEFPRTLCLKGLEVLTTLPLSLKVPSSDKTVTLHQW